MDEWFDLVNTEGARIGRALRSVCHGQPGLMHQAVHVLVFNRRKELFLQKRSFRKDIQPGKWDTSVGGHLLLGEDPHDGAVRELHEELGVTASELSFAYRYIWKSEVETEQITTYYLQHEGPFVLCPKEIDEGRFWTLPEIENVMGRHTFTPQFSLEYPRIRAVMADIKS